MAILGPTVPLETLATLDSEVMRFSGDEMVWLVCLGICRLLRSICRRVVGCLANGRLHERQ